MYVLLSNLKGLEQSQQDTDKILIRGRGDLNKLFVDLNKLFVDLNRLFVDLYISN